MRKMLSAALVLSVVSVVWAKTPEDEELSKLQGKWTMTVTDEAGNVLQSVKEVQGNRERLMTTLEGEVIHEHTVDFKIRRTDDVRVFTYWNREITQGSGKGKRFEEESSYLYQLRGDRMIVITGMLNDDPPVVPQLEVWKRVKR